MKYKINCYGWSAEFIAKTITNEQLLKIKELMEENGTDDVSEIRFDLDSIVDIYSGDIFHFTKPLDTSDMMFQVLDENDTILSEFNFKEIGSIYDIIEDFDDYQYYDLIPQENRNIYLSIDEDKGGIYSFEIESDTLPVASDFACVTGNIEAPDLEWDFIDSVYFKGAKIEPVDYLDNTGKAATVHLYEFED